MQIALNVSNEMLHEAFICLGTLLYGISIVLAKEAMDIGVGPYTFNALQHIVGTVMLLIFRPRLKKVTGGNAVINQCPPSKFITYLKTLPFIGSTSEHFELVVLGMCCALPTFFASTMNQIGLVTVEAGKSAFLTSLYVVITPMMQYFLRGSEAGLTTYTWYSAGISLLGSFFLSKCFVESITLGELTTLLGAVLFAIEINMMDHSVERVNCIDLTCMQMFTSMTCCIITALVMEPEVMWSLLSSSEAGLTYWGWTLVITGGAIEAIAFQFHMVGQIVTPSSRAALLMGLESVVTVVVAFMFLNEVLSYMELFGCALILASTMVVSTCEEEITEGMPISSSVVASGGLMKSSSILASTIRSTVRRQKSSHIDYIEVGTSDSEDDMLIAKITPNSFTSSVWNVIRVAVARLAFEKQTITPDICSSSSPTISSKDKKQ